ncbi:MAG: addiction module protein [Pseudomonadales bacterium]|jgi:hypothetical protein|nr:addiction module protein [Pseudomonadales bacterium]
MGKTELVASLDGPAEDSAAAAWDLEVCRRIDEIEAGRTRLLDVSEVLVRAIALAHHSQKPGYWRAR